MLKSTLSIVAFTVTFGFSVVLVGLLFGFPALDYSQNSQNSSDYTHKAQTRCSEQTAHEIEIFIAQDVRNGEMRNSNIRRQNLSSNDRSAIAVYSNYVRNYVEKSSSMNDSHLPSDFRSAWREHMKAWKDYSEFLDNQADVSKIMSNEKFNSIERRFDNEITDAWKETLLIGENYGASY